MKPLSDKKIQEGQAALVQKIQKERAEAGFVNVDNTLALGQGVPLRWDGNEFWTRPVSYREGLRFCKYQLRMQRIATNPPKSEAEWEAEGAALEEILALCHDMLDPKPEENPFGDSAPVEVGALVGFFLTCLTKQSGMRQRLRVEMPHRMTH